MLTELANLRCVRWLLIGQLKELLGLKFVPKFEKCPFTDTWWITRNKCLLPLIELYYARRWLIIFCCSFIPELNKGSLCFYASWRWFHRLFGIFWIANARISRSARTSLLRNCSEVLRKYEDYGIRHWPQWAYLRILFKAPADQRSNIS